MYATKEAARVAARVATKAGSTGLPKPRETHSPSRGSVAQRIANNAIATAHSTFEVLQGAGRTEPHATSARVALARGKAGVGLRTQGQKPPELRALTNPVAMAALNNHVAWGDPEALEPLMQEAGPEMAPYAHLDDDSCGAASLVAGLVLAGSDRYAPAIANLRVRHGEVSEAFRSQLNAHPHLQESVDALAFAGNVLERLASVPAGEVTVGDLHELRRASYIVANLDGFSREAGPEERPDLEVGLRLGTMGAYRTLLWGSDSIDVGGTRTDFAQTELRGGGLHFVLVQDLDLENPGELRRVMFDPATSKSDFSAITPADPVEERGQVTLGDPPSDRITQSWDVDEARARGSNTANFLPRLPSWG